MSEKDYLKRSDLSKGQKRPPRERSKKPLATYDQLLETKKYISFK